MEGTGKDQNVSLKELVCYGLGSFGGNIVYVLMTTYLMVFYTDSMELNLVAIGTLFLLSRVFDGFTDLIMGVIIDNIRGKWGKFKPYIVVGSFFVAITTTACFIRPDLSDTGRLIYAYITYFFWGLSFTSIDIPYWSLSAAVTQDPNERNKVVAVPRTIAYLSGLVANLAILPIVAMTGNWYIVAAISGLTVVIGYCSTAFGVKERYTVKNQQRQSIKDTIVMFIKNKPLMILMASLLTLEITNLLRSGFVIYYFKYNLNAEYIGGVLLSIIGLASMIGGVISPFIAKKIGKKNTAVYACALNVVFILATFFVRTNIPMLLVFNFLASVPMGVANIAQMSMLIDCVEYGQWKTGKRSEGAIFSANIFKTKLASAIGASACSFALAIIGYVPNVAQSTNTLLGMELIFTIIPGVLFIIPTLILLKYDLTESKYNEIVEELKVSAVSA